MLDCLFAGRLRTVPEGFVVNRQQDVRTEVPRDHLASQSGRALAPRDLGVCDVGAEQLLVAFEELPKRLLGHPLGGDLHGRPSPFPSSPQHITRTRAA
ncbi:hypothetical protein D3C72_1870200 [compost metagenome]